MKLNIQQIEALLFDVDGTLMDTDDRLVSQLARMLSWWGIVNPNFDPHRMARSLVMRMESPANRVYQILDRLGLDGPLMATNQFLQNSLGRKSPPALQIIPGVKPALSALKPHYQMAIVSARAAGGVQRFLTKFELNAFFDQVITGQTRHFTKPHPAPVLWAARQLEVPVEACLMIGDTTVDILAGKVAGAQTVGVLCGFGESDELEKAGADLILPSTADLPQVLLQRSGI